MTALETAFDALRTYSKGLEQTVNMTLRCKETISYRVDMIAGLAEMREDVVRSTAAQKPPRVARGNKATIRDVRVALEKASMSDEIGKV